MTTTNYRKLLRDKLNERLPRDDPDAEPCPEIEAEDEDDAPDGAADANPSSAQDEVEAKLSAWEEHVRSHAEASGGMVPPRVLGRGNGVTARLPDAATPCPSDTETLLNGLIAECRLLLHEVAFHSARLTYDPDDRIRFLESAQGLARTGAKVGETVARLRNGNAAAATHRHEMVYSRMETSPLPPASSRDPGNQ